MAIATRKIYSNSKKPQQKPSAGNGLSIKNPIRAKGGRKSLSHLPPIRNLIKWYFPIFASLKISKKSQWKSLALFILEL